MYLHATFQNATTVNPTSLAPICRVLPAYVGFQQYVPMVLLGTTIWRRTQRRTTTWYFFRGVAAARTAKRCANRYGRKCRNALRLTVSRKRWRRSAFSREMAWKTRCTARTTECLSRTARWTCICSTRRRLTAACSSEEDRF